MQSYVIQCDFLQVQRLSLFIRELLSASIFCIEVTIDYVIISPLERQNILSATLADNELCAS